jgi:protocatechuate 3,4-dioxygenase alpha subunit
MAFKQTPSQTVGPYFAYGLTAEQYGYPFDQIAGDSLVDGVEGLEGERIRIVGRVFDGDGVPVPDAMIEIWQADAGGRYAHPADGRGTNSGFRGFGRVGTGTDPECRFVFETIKPGSVDGRQAPHINVIVFARGILSHLYTRIYFADEGEANGADPILSLVPESRRSTLLATPDKEKGRRTYWFDIRLQGDDETVFFDV